MQQCKATTKSGNQCSRKATTVWGMCHQHGPVGSVNPPARCPEPIAPFLSHHAVAPTPAADKAPEQGESVQTAKCSPVATAERAAPAPLLTPAQYAAALAILTAEQVATTAEKKPARVKRCSVCHCEVNVFGCKPIRRSRPSGGYDGCRRASRSPAPLPIGWDAAALSGVQGSGPADSPPDVPGWNIAPTQSDAAPQWASALGTYHAPGKVRPVAVPSSYAPTTTYPPCPAFTIADTAPIHHETVDVPWDLSRMADDGCPWADAA